MQGLSQCYHRVMLLTRQLALALALIGTPTPVPYLARGRKHRVPALEPLNQSFGPAQPQRVDSLFQCESEC